MPGTRLRRHPHATHRVTTLQLVARGGEAEDRDGHTRIALSAQGARAAAQLRRMASRPIGDPAGLHFDWVPLDHKSPHLLLNWGGAASQPSRAGLTLDLASLEWHGPGGAPAACALDLARLLLLRGHVCVDFEDVRVVLPQVTHASVASGRGEKRLEQALAGSGIAWHGASHALVIVTFPAGGGRLRASKLAMNAVRDHASCDATVIFGTTTDAALPADGLRLTVLSG